MASSVGILYSCVAFRATVLAEFVGKNAASNIRAISAKVLAKIDSAQPAKQTFSVENTSFHYSVNDGLTFMCVAESVFSRAQCFTFLEDIYKRFEPNAIALKRQNTLPIPLAFNQDFSRILERQMAFFSDAANSSKIAKVREQIDEVKGVMIQNIDSIIQRGERLTVLQEKTQSLSDNAFKFKKQSTKLKSIMCMQNLKLTLTLIAIVLAIILVIVFSVCGANFAKCK